MPLCSHSILVTLVRGIAAEATQLAVPTQQAGQLEVLHELGQSQCEQLLGLDARYPGKHQSVPPTVPGQLDALPGMHVPEELPPDLRVAVPAPHRAVVRRPLVHPRLLLRPNPHGLRVDPVDVGRLLGATAWLCALQLPLMVGAQQLERVGDAGGAVLALDRLGALRGGGVPRGLRRRRVCRLVGLVHDVGLADEDLPVVGLVLPTLLGLSYKLDTQMQSAATAHDVADAAAEDV
mmetsp:Transcript_153882/g.269199  ORF Transcript_153882/g.269199 Transcript_153882/m.269199 type:complete len:235 (-) Transcript_153882:1293-1997(-)